MSENLLNILKVIKVFSSFIMLKELNVFSWTFTVNAFSDYFVG